MPDHDRRPESTVSVAVQTQTGWGRILDSFVNWCQPQAGWLVLDVGCGPGLLPALFTRAGCQAFGLDLDYDGFAPPRLYTALAQADALHLPFPECSFHLVTASNLLFLLPDPLLALCEMARITQHGGLVAVINPSEQMNLTAATALADQHNLSSIARDSLLTYARRAEDHYRWSKQDVETLFSAAGLPLTETALRMGSGLTRFAKGTKQS